MSDRDRAPGNPRPAPPSLEEFKEALREAIKRSPRFEVFVERLEEAGFRLWAWCPTCGSGVGATSHGQECPGSVYPPVKPG